MTDREPGLEEPEAPATDGRGAPDDEAGAPDGQARAPDQKEAMVRERQERRGYRETFGRRAGERFTEHDFPRSYPVPEPLDWRRALRAYIDGHDRNWEADRKFAEAAEEAEVRDSPAPAAGPGEWPVPDASRAEEAREDAGEEDAGTARTDEGTRFGVGVPDRDQLEFHRGASIWRDELEESRRMPRHTDRSLDGRRGRGEQA